MRTPGTPGKACETDPLGLLNRGKMIAWDNPDYDATQNRLHLFPSAAGAMR